MITVKGRGRAGIAFSRLELTSYKAKAIFFVHDRKLLSGRGVGWKDV